MKTASDAAMRRDITVLEPESEPGVSPAKTEPSTVPSDSLIGKSIPSIEAPGKLTGRALYTHDMFRPRMLYGALLGSPYPHARIVAIDTSAARSLSGVKAVLTAKDLPDQRIGIVFRDQPILAREKVRFVGEPVAAVAAETLKIARAAVRLITAQYEPLPPIFDAEEALEEDAPLLHERIEEYVSLLHAPRGGNLNLRVELETGNIEDAWKECDVVIENTYTTPAFQAMYMETNSALAEVDGSGNLTIWCSTQSIFSVQSQVALGLQLPMSKVRVIAPTVGGGFGPKSTPGVEPITGALALATRRPVKLVLTRDEDMTMMKTRHESKIRLKTGAKRDGTLVCREARLLYNNGAYADYGPVVCEAGTLFFTGPYRFPNALGVGELAYTNRQPGGACRGFGIMQPTFASESQLDELARMLEMDPVELRLKNAMRTGDYHLGSFYLESAHIVECLKAIREHPAFIAARAEKIGPTGLKRGVGVTGMMQGQGLFSTSATVRVAEDGTVVLNTNYVDIGTGSDTLLAQTCAEVLKLHVGQVHMTAPDTNGIAYDYGTVADRGARGVGTAVALAARDARDQLIENASQMLRCPSDKLELRRGGRVGIAGNPDAEVPFSAVAQFGLFASGGPIIGTHAYLMPQQTINPERTRQVGFDNPGLCWFGFGASAAQVEVNEETGQVRIVKYWYAIDLGRLVNPDGAYGQVYGGVVFGLGGALCEEIRWDNGRVTNPTLMDYVVLSANEIPEDIYPLLLEFPVPDSPFGAKGFAEPVVLGCGPAVANAVCDAVGVRIRSLPITPEKVLAGLMENDRAVQASRNSGPDRR